MKNLILIMGLASISFHVEAQSDSLNKKTSSSDFRHIDDGKTQDHDLIINPDQGIKNNPDPNTGNTIQSKTEPDGYMVQDGKMMMIVNGKFEKMLNQMTLSNGTLVMTDGYYKPKDGSKIKLMEGQLLDLNGEVIPRK